MSNTRRFEVAATIYNQRGDIVIPQGTEIILCEKENLPTEESSKPFQWNDDLVVDFFIRTRKAYGQLSAEEEIAKFKQSKQQTANDVLNDGVYVKDSKFSPAYKVSEEEAHKRYFEKKFSERELLDAEERAFNSARCVTPDPKGIDQFVYVNRTFSDYKNHQSKSTINDKPRTNGL